MDYSIDNPYIVQQMTQLIRKLIQDELKNAKANKEFQAVVSSDPNILGFASIIPHGVVGAIPEDPIVIPNVRVDNNLRLKENYEVLCVAINGNMNNLRVVTNKNDFTTLLRLPFRTITSSTNIKLTDVVIYVSAAGGNVVLTMPDVTKCSSEIYIFKRLDSTANTVTLVPSVEGQTFDGASSMSITVAAPKRWIQSDGTNGFWIIQG